MRKQYETWLYIEAAHSTFFLSILHFFSSLLPVTQATRHPTLFSSRLTCTPGPIAPKTTAPCTPRTPDADAEAQTRTPIETLTHTHTSEHASENVDLFEAIQACGSPSGTLLALFLPITPEAPSHQWPWSEAHKNRVPRSRTLLETYLDLLTRVRVFP